MRPNGLMFGLENVITLRTMILNTTKADFKYY